jgi:hypothetical protein
MGILVPTTWETSFGSLYLGEVMNFVNNVWLQVHSMTFGMYDSTLLSPPDSTYLNLSTSMHGADGWETTHMV